MFPLNLNPMMMHDFGFYCVKTLELPRRFDSPGVPSSPLESSPVLETFWRRPTINPRPLKKVRSVFFVLDMLANSEYIPN